MDNTADPQWQLIEVGGNAIEVRTSRRPPQGGRRLWPSVGEYPVYDEFFYGVMLQDEERNKLFREAITLQAEGRVVLELGVGPDLLWTSLAAESGAAKVFAVEVLEESARVARERARRIGPHVTVLYGDATQVVLPQDAELCIAELVGAIGGAEGIAAAVDDARRRHLRPGAPVVPHRVRTPIAALGARALLGDAPALHPEAASYTAQVFDSVESIFDVRMCLSGVSYADLLTDTAMLEDLNLTSGAYDNPREIHLKVTRPGEIDSFVLWLQLQCAASQPYLDSMDTDTNWTPVLVPFDTDRAVRVEVGDTLAVTATRRLYDEVHPEWSFAATVRHRDGTVTPVRAECPYANGPVRASWLHRALFRDPVPTGATSESSGTR
ncbi:hypothetical protein GCM10023322_71550 [Rugosimonospora acidiphila]|uniref:Protein arginine N-methyltransferase 1 n=1 Tax=Rugosimonospora acidiphila TaxID=556531 RepID=A0ABP9SL07_9ACTN